MKTITNTLKTKYQNAVKNDKAKLSKFLKRRRNELGKTLEEVSEGICSTSYLSKIENCQVEVDESYFSMLFEKLDLSYKDVVESRKVPVYPDVIKAYLLNDYNYLTDKVNNFCKNNSYCETEVEVLVTLYNIVSCHYHEVEVSLKKLEDIRNTLTKEELEFVGFLNALYNFKIKNLKGVEEELDILLSIVSKEDILYIALIDLTLDVCFDIGHVAKFYEKFNYLKNSSFGQTYPKIFNRHLLQKQLFLNIENNNDMTAQLDEIKEQFLDDLDQFNYFYAIALTRNGKYQDAYELMLEAKPNLEGYCLMAYCVDNINNYGLQDQFIKILKNIECSKGPYNDYIEYIRLKLEQYSYNQLYIYLKNVLNKYHQHQNFWVFNLLRINFNKLAFELGKYKEAVKFGMIN